MSVCKEINIGGTWLANGELETCLLKFLPPSETEYNNDLSRTSNLTMLEMLLKGEAGSDASIIKKLNKNKAALLLGPELAFGSCDYDGVRALISTHDAPLIFISGFGFTIGSKLSQLAAESKIISTWESINPTGIYNCGWIWVSNGNGDITCHVFLKNFSEQTYEINVNNISRGNEILKIVSNDLIIFPLICADLICSTAQHPREAIKNNLSSHPPTSAQRVLITASLYADKPSSDTWKIAMNDLLGGGFNCRIALCNCYDPTPVNEEEKDQWRCLSGVYQPRTPACKPPESPQRHARYVQENQYSGFVLRVGQNGFAFGGIGWEIGSTTKKYPWTPPSRYLFHNNSLILHDGCHGADELHRFILRFKCAPYKSHYSDEVSAFADEIIKGLLSQLDSRSPVNLRSKAEEIFNKCLSGVLYKEKKNNLDQLHLQKNSLDTALIILLFIKRALDGDILPNIAPPIDYGQILINENEKEILVWSSETLSGSDMYGHLERIAQDGGSARPLIVIGKGDNNYKEPQSSKISSTRITNIAETIEKGEHDISDPKDRVIFWKQLGEFGTSFKKGSNREKFLKDILNECSGFADETK